MGKLLQPDAKLSVLRRDEWRVREQVLPVVGYELFHCGTDFAGRPLFPDWLEIGTGHSLQRPKTIELTSFSAIDQLDLAIGRPFRNNHHQTYVEHWFFSASI